MKRYGHPLYATWCSMLYRCCNPKHKSFRHYGGRGIRVCRRWKTSFENFVTDMGPRPEGMQLDRYPDNNGDYKPSNCRWATRSQQHRNKRNNHLLTFKGKTMTMWDWADRMGIDPMSLFRRIKHGWTVEEALSIPVRGGRKGMCRRVVWRVTKDASPAGMKKARKELEKTRLARYKTRHPERFWKPKKVYTRCRRCSSSPVTGTSLCWNHSFDNPEYKKAYQKAYQDKIRQEKIAAGIVIRPVGRPRKIAA